MASHYPQLGSEFAFLRNSGKTEVWELLTKGTKVPTLQPDLWGFHEVASPTLLTFPPPFSHTDHQILPHAHFLSLLYSHHIPCHRCPLSYPSQSHLFFQGLAHFLPPFSKLPSFDLSAYSLFPSCCSGPSLFLPLGTGLHAILHFPGLSRW